MSDVIVQGIFLLAATGLGGALGFLSSRSGAEISKLREQNTRRSTQIRKFLQQIEAYHLLEDLYASDLAGLPGSLPAADTKSAKSVKTIKTEYRNRVVEIYGCSRPEMTAAEAKKRLEDL